MLPYGYFLIHHFLSLTKIKISEKPIGFCTVFLHKSILQLTGYPMIPISHIVISGNPPGTPHSRCPILRNFFHHKILQNFSKKVLSLLPELPDGYFLEMLLICYSSQYVTNT